MNRPIHENRRRWTSLCLLLLAAPAACGAEEQVTGLSARHQAGQTMLSWKEVAPPVTEETIAAVEVRELRREAEKSKKVRYRIYRSSQPIASLEGLEPIAEAPPLTCWNIDYYGDVQPQHKALRYVIEEGKEPVAPGTGIYAYNPDRAGSAYYAVTVSQGGRENKALSAANALSQPVVESVGRGVPVLQRIERPKLFQFLTNTTLHYYVRWESPPNCSEQGMPFDYVVGVPPKLAKPAPVGIHLHGWGGSLNGGYGWWYGAERGHLLLATNQIPYDWWTGYHERYWKGPMRKESWQAGVVRPYTQTRLLSFLDWVAAKWDVDRTRTHVAGNSMGGSGAVMMAIRHPDEIAWATAWVGVHDPARSPQFKSSYLRVYGEPEWGVKFQDGTPVWDYFNDSWYLRRYPEKEIGLICYSNGKNDGAIGWPQAVEFYRAMTETKRPQIFVWGQAGHGQRAVLPISLSDRDMPVDLRSDQSLPAFTGCSLDKDPGDGDPKNGDPGGQVNLYLFWQTDNVVDRADRWEMTVGLVAKAPQPDCTVNLTPRRLQQFRPQPGRTYRWSNTSLPDNREAQSGQVTADALGLVTLEKVNVGKGKNRIAIAR